MLHRASDLAISCERSNEASVPVKGHELFDYPTECRLLKGDLLHVVNVLYCAF
jgi:hypothetical protein